MAGSAGLLDTAIAPSVSSPTVAGARTKRVEVRVHGGRYPVQAPATQRAEERLQAAARLVGERIEAIAAATGEVSSQRLAVMASLDLATELLTAHEDDERSRADDAAFRRAVRDRSERLLGLVQTELADRHHLVESSAPSRESALGDVDS